LSCAPLQPVLILVVTVPEVDRQHKQWPAFVRQLVHACLGIVFSILKTLPENGIPFVCPDKEYRLGFLRLAAWIADYKEQVRLALIVSGRCAICVASRAEMNLLRAFPAREGTVSDKLRMGGLSEKDQKTLGLKPGLVSRILGFWCSHWSSLLQSFACNIPDADSHAMMAPDLLHQIIKPFSDHIVTWVLRILDDPARSASKPELNRRSVQLCSSFCSEPKAITTQAQTDAPFPWTASLRQRDQLPFSGQRQSKLNEGA
jgi:hypothetical protein